MTVIAFKFGYIVFLMAIAALMGLHVTWCTLFWHFNVAELAWSDFSWGCSVTGHRYWHWAFGC
jgi:hypothetical protein